MMKQVKSINRVQNVAYKPNLHKKEKKKNSEQYPSLLI